MTNRLRTWPIGNSSQYLYLKKVLKSPAQFLHMISLGLRVLFSPFEWGLFGPFPKSLIFEIGKNDHRWSNPQFLECWGEWRSFFKKILVLGSIPSILHVGYNFERQTQAKVKTKWQLYQKIACARETLMPCHFRLRFDCAQSMQSVKLCICMYWLIN